MNLRIILALIGNACIVPLLYAAPTDGQISAGNGSIAQAGTSTTITQQSQKLAIDWRSFSIAADESVRFNQPDATSIALNRILGSDPSQIFGNLSANGQVFILNPNGVMFGNTAQVSVGGLVASTLSLNNAEFMVGNNVFARTDQAGAVVNRGNLSVTHGGYIALIAPHVNNEGTITATMGTALLAAGNKVTLNLDNGSLVGYSIDQGSFNALVENNQLIQADGGQVILSAQASDLVTSGAVNNTGIIQAKSISNVNGTIRLEGDFVSQSGILDASGIQGGSIDITARAIIDSGTAYANGSADSGGDISMTASSTLIQTAAASTRANGSTQGGTIRLHAGNNLFSSGSLSATGQTGGTIDVLGNNRIVLAAALLDASGLGQGGLIRIGGDFYGSNPDISNAQTTIINHATRILNNGGDGKVVVWSDQATTYSGNIQALDRGLIEISSKGTLRFNGFASGGIGGQLLLDPTNIVIDAGSVDYGTLLDPNPRAENYFGLNTTTLGMTEDGVFKPSGTFVVAVPFDDTRATDAGAVYLFDSNTGALKTILSGSTPGDRVGGGGVIRLSNGNYVVSSPFWSNPFGINGLVAANAGAATWGHATLGVSGHVNPENSLVGDKASDYVSATINLADNVKLIGITALSNGHYVVNSPQWSNGTQTAAGAVTWGNGTTGTTGSVSMGNSLVGSTAQDNVGSYGITVLSNGNYVVGSPDWDNRDAVDAGAVTWGDGTTVTSGVVSEINSLVGAYTTDRVGLSVTALSNGNYVVSSAFWNNSNVKDAGAVTWGDGMQGVKGAVTFGNSLVGSNIEDQIGLSGITVLTNGNYVVNSANWDSGSIIDAGASTWGNGRTGTSGLVSANNSLVGSTNSDQVGLLGATALSNGNYVVRSPLWDRAIATNAGPAIISDAGAATWGDGTVTGAISSSNSLVGDHTNDQVGSGVITALTNGNYVVSTPSWTYNTGAVTWGNGATGIHGVVSANNSLVGRSGGDQVGYYVTALNNGNYVVSSPNWNNGNLVNVGAATWGNGTIGVVGIIDNKNSLVGGSPNDLVSKGGITALSNGNYVVSSPQWDKRSNIDVKTDAGAATWGNGTTGITGVVSESNSLVGGSSSDRVSYDGVTALTHGNYVVSSGFWNNGGAFNSGAVTWGIGTVGIAGQVSAQNSLVGANANDQMGSERWGSEIEMLDNGRYLVTDPKYSNNTGRVLIASPTPNLTGDVSFNDSIGFPLAFTASSIVAILSSGTAVTLQASNDITLNSAITVNSSAGGAFKLQAGRNINLNADITTGNGDFTAVAGDTGMVADDRDSGIPTITLGAGASINAGTGTVLLAANGGNFVNNSGSAAPLTANRWLVYSSDPSANSAGGMIAPSKHYAQNYVAGETPDYATTGNWNLYSIAPVLSVTPSAQTIGYGTHYSNVTPQFSGFIDGDNSATSGISGTPLFTIPGSSEYAALGSHDVAYNRGLASSLGYTFADNAVSTDELTVVLPQLIPVAELTVNPLASILSGTNTSMLAYTAHTGVDFDTQNPALVSTTDCGVQMPQDAPANACQ